MREKGRGRWQERENEVLGIKKKKLFAQPENPYYL